MSDSNKHVSFCPHCGHDTIQILLYTHIYEDTFQWTKDKESITEFSSYICSCEKCNGLIIYDGACFLEPPAVYDRDYIVFPEIKPIDESIPKTIAECYKEALEIKWKSPSTFAVLIRKCLEGMCRDRGLNSGNLYNDLTELAKKGEIPPLLVEMTDTLRTLGNIGAHWSDEKMNNEHVEIIDDFFKSIIEYVYIAPGKLKKYHDKQKNLRMNENND